MFESLEARRLLAYGTLASGTLTVNATDHRDTIQVNEVGSNLQVRIGTFAPENFPKSTITKVVVNGNRGADTVLFGFTSLAPATTVNGGAGNDTINGTGGIDSINGGGGDDRLIGSASNDTIIGGDGNDTIDGGAGNDNLLGNGGADSIIGGSGTDTLNGGAGNDNLSGGKGTDNAFTEGTDTLSGIESSVPGGKEVYVEFPNSLTIAAATDATTHVVTLTLTFANVANDSQLTAKWTRREANRFVITADYRKNTENLAPTLATRTFTINLGKQVPGTYEVWVWSGSGKTKQTFTFTVTWGATTTAGA